MMEAETDRFVTVVAVEAAEEYVTVLSVGGGEQEGEDVLVYRLPGERLGFGLKFEGGTATGERVRRLFIQSCAPDSPASRAACSWGSLQEGDEVLQIDSVPVHMMTRLDCVRCLKDSNVVLKLRVRHAPPPPVPPRRCKDRPPEPEVYLDLLAQEAAACLTESESDDTGSSISTVVIDVAKVLSPFEQLERELEDEGAPPLQPPLNFQDAPLSYGDEKVLPPKPAPRRDAAFRSGKKRPPPPPPPRSDRPQCPLNVQSIAVAEADLGDLPRLVDVVPKSEYDGEVRPAIAEGRECILLGEEIPYFRKDMMDYKESTSELMELQKHSVDSIFETIELEPEPMENTDYISTTPKMITKTISTEGDISESESVDKQNNKPMTTENIKVVQNDSPKEIEALMIEVLTTVECETSMSDQTDGDSILMRHIGFNSTMPETDKPLKVGNEADYCHSLIIENNNIDTALGNNENRSELPGNEDDIMIEKEEKLLKLSDEERQIEPEVFGKKEIIYKCLRNGAIKPNILEKDENRHIILEHKAETSENEENVTVKDGFNVKSKIFVNEQENILENTDNYNKQSEIVTEIIGQDKNQFNLTNDRPQPTENGENRQLVMASKEIKSAINEENTSTKINHKTSEKDIVLTSPLGMKPELSETEGRKDDVIYEKEILFKISEVERNKGTKSKPTASDGDNKVRDSDNGEKKHGGRDIKSKLPVPEHEKALTYFGKRDSKSKATEIENKPIIIGSVEIGSKTKEQTFIEKTKIKTTETEENRHLEIESNKIRSKIPISKIERSKALVIENSDIISKTTKGNEEIRTKLNEIKENKRKVTEENEIKHKLTSENNPVETEILSITSNFSTLEITETVPESKINGGEKGLGGKGAKSDLEINRPEVIGCVEVLENKPEVTEPKLDRPSGADRAESKSAEEANCTQVTSNDSTPVLSANDSDSDEDFVLELPEWGGGSVFQPGIGMRCWGLATIGEDEEDSDNSNMLPGLSVVSEEDEDCGVSVAEHSEKEATNNGMEDTQLRRLPPDGHEFPPSYTEHPPEPITEVEKQPPPLPITEPPPVLKPAVRIPNWRKDEKSECSVRDKIAMFSSAVTKMERSPSFRTATIERTHSSLSMSDKPGSMEHNHSSLNLFPLTDAKSTNLDRTHSSLDLSYSPGQYCSTLPRKPVMSSPTESAPRLTRATSFSGGSLHTRSQSLIDIGRGTMEDMRKASLNALIEQRRRGISKLRGLVIPEKVSEITAPSPSICDLPEIRSKDSIFSKTISTPVTTQRPNSAPVATSRWSTPSATTNPVPSVIIPSPPWKASNSSNLPKYSPAFKRKSLTVYGSSSSSIRDEPPASLESITSPARSDLSFEYKLPMGEKNISPTGQHLSTEDESDTDSAVSSSRSSISPPPTPPPPPLHSPLHRTLSSETTTSASSSTASTITCGSSDSNRRVLKAQSVEAINRKNVLSSARYSSGRDLKVGSPLIQRKFDEEERRVAYVTDVEEPTTVKPLPAPRRVPVPPKPVQRKSMEVNPEEEADLLSVLMGGRMRRQRSKDNVLSDDKRSASVHDIRKTFEMAGRKVNHARVSSLDSTASEDSFTPQYGSVGNLHREQFGSVTSIASSTSLISPQELQVLIDEANQPLDDCDVVVVVLHREGSTGSVGITLAGGADYEAKEITVHKVLAGSPADKDGRIQKGDRILSINGRSMKGMTHRESLNILKAPRSEVVLVVSRSRGPQESNHEDEFSVMAHVPRPSRPPRIPEQPVETVSILSGEDRGPPVTVTLTKDGAGLGFSLEGGKDSPLGDKPLTIKKIFTGGSAEKNGELFAGDELLNVNGSDVTLLSRIEAWGLMKRLPDGPVALTVRHRLNK